jgi:GntR family transcriptional regulator
MNITINVKDGVPIYRQIANQVRYMVASGLLLPGDEIDPVRTLALRLKVTPNTIVKAYSELEAAGVIFKRRGAGTYIAEADAQSPLADRERNRIIEQRVDVLLAEAHQLNFSSEELLTVIRRQQSALSSQAKARKSKKGKSDD